MSIPIDPRVLALLAEAGVGLRPVDGGTLVGDQTGGLLLVQGASGWQATWVERGAELSIELRRAPTRVVEAFLVLWFLNRWRERHGLRHVRRSSPGTLLPEGMRLSGDRDGLVDLEIVEDGDVTVLPDLDPATARGLARLLAVPLDEVLASVGDPEGLPLFGQ